MLVLVVVLVLDLSATAPRKEPIFLVINFSTSELGLIDLSPQGSPGGSPYRSPATRSDHTGRAKLLSRVNIQMHAIDWIIRHCNANEIAREVGHFLM